MPTFIKTGYWESAVKSYKGWLNLEDLISGIAISGSGTAGQIAFWTNTSVQSGSSNLVWDATNNRLGIRSSSPTGNFEVKTSDDLGLARLYLTDGNSTPLQLYRGNNGNVPINTFVNNGTITAPTDVSISGAITRITGNIYLDGAYRSVARMEYITTSIPAIGNPPTAIRFFTTDNSYALSERFGSTSNGNFQIGDSITTNKNSRLFVKSSGSTAATWTAQFQNSSLNNALVIDDAGSVMLGTATSSGERLQVNGTARVSGQFLIGTSPFASRFVPNGQLMSEQNYLDGATDNTGATGAFTIGSAGNISNLSGSAKYYQNLYLKSNITTSYNLAEVNEAVIATLINGTSTGVMRGLYINPTITSGGTGWLAIQSSIGGAYFNTTSVAASAILQADSTTKGFLPPRLTTTQKNAIGTPAAGLVIYDTDLNKLCVYTGATWQTITSA